MSKNPFNDVLDWSLQGKKVRVIGGSGEQEYTGWLDRIHHNRGSVVLHDAYDVTRGEQVGSVFVRTTSVIVEETPYKRVRMLAVDELRDSPFYEYDYSPRDYHMRRCYRNGFAGSFPVVRPRSTKNDDGSHDDWYELINGHKRVEAMRRVGLTHHPFEIIECTDEEAKELFELAHREYEIEEDPSAVDGQQTLGELTNTEDTE